LLQLPDSKVQHVRLSGDQKEEVAQMLPQVLIVEIPEKKDNPSSR
jgi:hypothetical protein